MTAPTVYHLRNNDGVETFTGTISPAPGGGSQPGAWGEAHMLFNEPEAAHAALTASVDIPAGATVREIELVPLVGPWADAPASLTVGDSDSPTFYYNSNSPGVLANYDPSAAVAGTNYLFVAIDNSGDGTCRQGLWPAVSGEKDGGGGKTYPTGDTITATLSNITTGGGGGQMLVRVIYSLAVEPVVAA